MNYETGNAVNVSQLEKLISRLVGFGVTYNPSNTLIKLPGLNSTLTSAQASLLDVDTKLIFSKNQIDSREILFIPLSKLTTRITNALACCGTTPQIISDALTFARKLQGKRAVPIKPVTPTPAPTTEATPLPTPTPVPVPVPTPKNISASQMGYDNRIENFQKLILLLISEPLYNPNEADLKVTALQALLASMRAANSAVINSNTALKNSRISRDKVLYAPTTGVYDLQLEVKKYVKSVYGATSAEYKEISKIEFTNQR